MLSLCLAACGAWAVADRMAVEQEPPLGYVAQLCVGVNALPAWLGISWISSPRSDVVAGIRPHSACLPIPWLPSLPRRGEFYFPDARP